jgi:hypothetical protein
MAEKLFYYSLALTLVGGFFLVYNIIVTELRSRRERIERERLHLAYEEIKRLRASESTKQQESRELAGWDSQDGVTVDLIKQVGTELNQRVMNLEREL